MKTPGSSDHKDSSSLSVLPDENTDASTNGAQHDGAAADLARVGDEKVALPSQDSNGLTPPPKLPDLPDLSEFTRKPGFALPVLNWAGNRIELVAVILALLVAGLLVPYVLTFATRHEWGRSTPSLPFLETLEAMELRLYDSRFAARDRVTPKALDKIAIVAIDDTSTQIIGERPWTRDWYAKLVRRLKKAGARVTVLDLNFTPYQFPQKDPVTGNIKKDPETGEVLMSEYDKDLVAAAAEAKNVVLPSSFRPFVQKKDASVKTSGNHTFTPFDELDAEIPDIALNFQSRDPDGGVRRYVTYGNVSGADVGTIATLAAGMYQNRLDGNENKLYYQDLKAGVWPDLNGVKHRIPLFPMQVGDDKLWATPIHYYGPPRTFPNYSFSDVVGMGETKVKNPKTGKEEIKPVYRWSDEQLKEKFGGRIVFLGSTSEIDKDLFLMPTFRPRPGEDITNQIPGVEMHATVTAMLLGGDYMQVIPSGMALTVLFALTLITSLWTAVLRSPINKVASAAQFQWHKFNAPGSIHSLVWIGLYVCLAALPIILFWQIGQWLFNQRNLWVIFTYPAVSSVMSSGIVMMLLFSVEAVSRRKLSSAFSKKVSPDVMEYILAHPEGNAGRPRRVYATVLFTDLEGFTTYSETHEPEEVVEATNAFMNRMEPVVLAYGGSVDKYIGDAIMAWFGAIIPRYDHASQALLCAVAMQEECARFREETGIPFYMRIGVHTGDLLIGDMGSENRSDFTVIGDTVNLASRLEGKNKDFGSWIMCSAATYESAPDVVSVESASAQIKGKSQAVEVYIVRGLAGDQTADSRWGRQLTEAEKQKQLMDAHFKRIAEAEAALSEAKELPAPLKALPQGNMLSNGRTHEQADGEQSQSSPLVEASQDAP